MKNNNVILGSGYIENTLNLDIIGRLNKNNQLILVSPLLITQNSYETENVLNITNKLLNQYNSNYINLLNSTRLKVFKNNSNYYNTEYSILYDNNNEKNLFKIYNISRDSIIFRLNISFLVKNIRSIIVNLTENNIRSEKYLINIMSLIENISVKDVIPLAKETYSSYMNIDISKVKKDFIREYISDSEDLKFIIVDNLVELHRLNSKYKGD